MVTLTCKAIDPSPAPPPPQLIQELQPLYNEPSTKAVKIFRDFWLYCIIMGFSNFSIGEERYMQLDQSVDYTFYSVILIIRNLNISYPIAVIKPNYSNS